MFPLHFPYRASPCAIRFQLSSTPTLCRKVLFEMLALLLPNLVKKFTLLYGNRGFITVFTRARNVSLSSLRQPTLSHHISLLPFNNIIPSMPMSSRWPPSSRFPNHNSVCIYSLLAREAANFCRWLRKVQSSLLPPFSGYKATRFYRDFDTHVTLRK